MIYDLSSTLKLVRWTKKMKLGLVADTYNDAVKLRRALRLLRNQGAEKIFTLGDTFDSIDETYGIGRVAELLVDHEARNVFVVRHTVRDGWCGLLGCEKRILLPIPLGIFSTSSFC